jgi:hypothetical protein
MATIFDQARREQARRRAEPARNMAATNGHAPSAVCVRALVRQYSEVPTMQFALFSRIHNLRARKPLLAHFWYGN